MISVINIVGQCKVWVRINPDDGYVVVILFGKVGEGRYADGTLSAEDYYFVRIANP